MNRVALFAAALVVGGCAQAHDRSAVFMPAAAALPTLRAARDEATQVQHVVIVVQENRTPDDLFRGLPGADTAPPARLHSVSLRAPYDIDHSHRSFTTEYAHGTLRGFAAIAMGYVPRREAQPYFQMAEQYTFADRMFQTNEGPSFPAHQYLVSGTSSTAPGSGLLAAENPPGNGTIGPLHEGGCDSSPGTVVALIDAAGNENQTAFPCFDRPSLTDLLDARGLSWRYYEAFTGSGLWNGLDAIKHVHDSPEFVRNVVAPSSQVLADISAGTLANVSWVTPDALASDHAGITDGSGPAWVAAVVNAIGHSRYWNDTVVLVTWDDWGGWYDHVKPTQYTSYELGFRVPLIVISPYAKPGYVSHQTHEFGSLLKFVEDTFGLPSLGATDQRADDLSDCFDWRQAPIPFRTIGAPYSSAFFLHRRPSVVTPDSD